MPRHTSAGLGAGPGGADLPAAGVFEQACDCLRARHGDPPCQREPEGGPDPQHIPLAAFFAEAAQFGAGAVDLVAAQEIEPGAIGTRLGADVNGKLALGAEPRSPGKPVTSAFTGSLM